MEIILVSFNFRSIPTIITITLPFRLILLSRSVMQNPSARIQNENKCYK